MDEEKLINEVLCITPEIDHLLTMRKEGRELPNDGQKCLEMVKRLEAIVCEFYGITDGGDSQQQECDRRSS